MIDTRQPITRAEFRAPSARKRLTAGGLMLAGGVLLAGAVLPARADVESVTVRLEEARCFSWTARIESNLRRLEGVRSVRSSLAAGTVTVQWRPGIPLDLARLKEAVLRWRGAVRYGGAVVTVVGVIEDPDGSGAASTTPLLRALGTGQRFSLRAGAGASDPAQLRRGEAVRITGRVIKSREGKNDEIWLELERDSSQK